MGTATLIPGTRSRTTMPWLAVCDSVKGLRQQYGCTAGEVMADVGSTELKEAMGRAGVAGPPRIEIAVEA